MNQNTFAVRNTIWVCIPPPFLSLSNTIIHFLPFSSSPSLFLSLSRSRALSLSLFLSLVFSLPGTDNRFLCITLTIYHIYIYHIYIIYHINYLSHVHISHLHIYMFSPPEQTHVHQLQRYMNAYHSKTNTCTSTANIHTCISLRGPGRSLQ